MWTLQELALSPQRIVYCGSATCHWETFYAAILELDKLRPYHLGQSLEAQNSLRNLSTRSKTAMKSESASLAVSALRWVNLQRCADPRDKIFALYGLLHRICASFPAPNYTKSVDHVYREVAVSVIVKEGAPELLTLACELRGQMSLPTWIPDWTGENATTLWPWQTCASSRDSLVRYRICSNWRDLYLRGKIIGSVFRRATRKMLV